MRPVLPAMKIFLPCLALIAGLLAYAQAATAGSLRPNVVVTAAPLKPIADALLRNIAISTALPHHGQDAHSMQLSPSQMRAIATADVIIMPDTRMNTALHQRIVEQAPRHARIVSLVDLPGAAPLLYPEYQTWLGDAAGEPGERAVKGKSASPDGADSLDGLLKKTMGAESEAASPNTAEAKSGDDDGDEAKNPPYDPHLWLDPLRMAALAPALAEAIADQAPTQRMRLRYNADLLARHLREVLHPALRTILQSSTPQAVARKPVDFPFVASHQSYQYFLARYGIANPGALVNMPENVMGARSKHDLLTRAGEVRIRCVIAEHRGPLETRVAAASSARLVMLSPEYGVEGAPHAPAWANNDYDRLLFSIARVFADCLGK